MKLPLLLTNFKATETAIGKKAIALAQIHQKVAEETGVNIAVAVQIADIYPVAQAVNIPVFAQHCDPVSLGSRTGWILPETLKEAGAQGVVLNHSEHRFADFDNLGVAITRAKALGLYVVCCAETDDEGKMIMEHFAPDLVAVEPPELIGGDISVSTAQPELIKNSVAKIGAGKVLVGAGVKNSADTKIAAQLGAVGILVASGVTKAVNPEEAIKDLASGMI